VGTLGDGRGPGGVNKSIISNPQPLDTVTSFSLLASQVGRAISESLRPTTKGLQEQQASDAAGIRREKDAGYIYSEEELYLMMGWAHVRRFSDLPDVWLEFMKTKKVDTFQDKLMEAMAVWVKQHDLQVDDEVHFMKTQLEEIIQLKHSPGTCVAEYESAEKGIGPLLCTPISERDQCFGTTHFSV